MVAPRNESSETKKRTKRTRGKNEGAKSKKINSEWDRKKEETGEEREKKTGKEKKNLIASNDAHRREHRLAVKG